MTIPIAYEEKEYPVETRFGEIVATELWGIVPYALYRYQRELNLSIADVWFLSWVIMHRWEAKDSYPSLNALSRHTGKSRSYIQRVAHRLRDMGLLDIKERKLNNNAIASNFYDIQPLVEKLEEAIKSDPISQYNKGNNGGIPVVASP